MYLYLSIFFLKKNASALPKLKILMSKTFFLHNRHQQIISQIIFQRAKKCSTKWLIKEKNNDLKQIYSRKL